MYHIWPSYGQTHLFHGQDRDDTARCSGTTNGEEFAVEFVGDRPKGGIAAMHKYGNTRSGQFPAIYFFKARGIKPALLASESASQTRRTIRSSTRSARSPGASTLRFKLLAKA